MNKLKFCGEFNKAENYFGWRDSGKFENIGSDKDFDKSLFDRVSKDIESILGKKKKYDIFEISRYFKIKYLAFRIQKNYFWYYKDTYTDFLPAFDNKPEMEALNESYNDSDKNITLVIDTVFNLSLRKQYPQIEYFDECNEKSMQNDSRYTCRHENPIFILGTKDGKHLNSIYTLSGDFEIEDLNYEFYYFYIHS